MIHLLVQRLYIARIFFLRIFDDDYDVGALVNKFSCSLEKLQVYLWLVGRYAIDTTLYRGKQGSRFSSFVAVLQGSHSSLFATKSP